MFDLPISTSDQRRAYSKFMKFLKSNGFQMMQESVYVKLLHNGRNIVSELKEVSDESPKEGLVCTIPLNISAFKRALFGGNGRFDIAVFSEDVVVI